MAIIILCISGECFAENAEEVQRAASSSLHMSVLQKIAKEFGRLRKSACFHATSPSTNSVKSAVHAPNPHSLI
jgi:hypothetical protein